MPSLLEMEFCIIGSDGLFSVLAFQTAVNMVKDSVSRGRSGEEAVSYTHLTLPTTIRV